MKEWIRFQTESGSIRVLEIIDLRNPRRNRRIIVGDGILQEERKPTEEHYLFHGTLSISLSTELNTTVECEMSYLIAFHLGVR